MIIHDYRNWEGRARFYDDEKPYGAVLGVPLRWRECIGVLYVADSSRRRFTEADAESLAMLANQAAMALEQHARLSRFERLQLAATHIPDVSGSEFSLSAVPAQIVKNAVSIFKADIAAFWPYSQELGEYVYAGFASAYNDDARPGDVRNHPPVPPVNRGQETSDWLSVSEVNEDETRRVWSQMEICGFRIIVPSASSEMLGILVLAYKKAHRPSEEDAASLQKFADYAALALKQANLLRRLHSLTKRANNCPSSRIRERERYP